MTAWQWSINWWKWITTLSIPRPVLITNALQMAPLPPGGEGRWRVLELAQPFINNNNANNQWREDFPVSSIKNRHQSINYPQPITIDCLYRLTNNWFHIIRCYMYLTVLKGTSKKTRSSLQITRSLLTTSSSLFGISGNSSVGIHSGLAADCI